MQSPYIITKHIYREISVRQTAFRAARFMLGILSEQAAPVSSSASLSRGSFSSTFTASSFSCIMLLLVNSITDSILVFPKRRFVQMPRVAAMFKIGICIIIFIINIFNNNSLR